MLIEVMRMRIMNNEKKIQDAEKEAGGDEKLIFKFAWPKTLFTVVLARSSNSMHASSITGASAGDCSPSADADVNSAKAGGSELSSRI